jgi:hypothetical protein
LKRMLICCRSLLPPSLFSRRLEGGRAGVVDLESGQRFRVILERL